MWREQLEQLKQAFPEAVRLYRGAIDAEILRTEDSLNLKISEIASEWLEFLRYTNGASLLDYCFLGAMTTRIASISEVNLELWRFNPWAREHFLSFLGDSTGMAIGFVRRDQEARCIGYMREMYDTVVLPIASSFTTFISSFLEDVQITLRTWKPQLGEEIPYEIKTQDLWPWDLKPFCERDLRVKAMLDSGSLDDLFRHDDEYAAVVDSVLRL
jgi:hypothetical protein